MKAACQILRHLLAVWVGYALVSSAARPEPRPASSGKGGTPNLTKPLSVRLAQNAPPAPSGIEGRLAALTAENWASEMGAIAALPLSDLAPALRGALRMRFPNRRRRLVRMVMERWVALDRTTALAALEGISSPQTKISALRAILDYWAKEDPDAAWQWVASLDHDSVLQESGIEHLLSRTAGKQPEYYRAWALALDEPFLRGKVLQELAQTWAQEDPSGAFEAAIRESDPFLRDKLFEEALRQNSALDPEAVLERILQLPDKAERLCLLEQMRYRAFVQDTPETAFRWLAARSDRPELQRMAAALGGVLAKGTNNLAGLLAQGHQLPAGPLRDAFFAHAAMAWLETGKAREGGQQLLDLCGSCLEKEEAVLLIRSRSQ